MNDQTYHQHYSILVETIRNHVRTKYDRAADLHKIDLLQGKLRQVTNIHLIEVDSLRKNLMLKLGRECAPNIVKLRQQLAKVSLSSVNLEALESTLQLVQINPDSGDEFDPNRHETLSPGTGRVRNVLRLGYMCENICVLPALVEIGD